MPRLPIGDFYEHLINPALTNRHADKLLSEGTLQGICRGDLADALERAQLLYIQGCALTEGLKEQRVLVRDLLKRGILAARGLLTQPKAPPTHYGLDAFIQAMRILWEEHSPRARGWVSYGDGLRKTGADGRCTNEHDGPFQRFVIDWLTEIDPGQPPPSRHSYSKAKKRMT